MVLDRFRRRTRDGRWLPEIDGLRFLAIASVLLFHATGEFLSRGATPLLYARTNFFVRHIVANGDRGVRLFFVLSGFIVALPFARHHLLGQARPSLRSFYLRRLTRLEPPFLLSLALIATFQYLVRAHHGLPNHYAARLAATALYLHGPLFHGMSRISFVTWSLEVEVQFYLFAPLLTQVFRLRPAALRRVLLLAMMAVMGWVQVRFWWNTWFLVTLFVYLQYFLGGLLLADIFITDDHRIPAGFAWDAFSLAGWCVVFFWQPHAGVAHIALAFLLPLLCLAALKGSVVRAFFRAPVVAVTGGMCYSIYLLHIPLLAGLFRLTHTLVPTRRLGFYLAGQYALVLPPLLLACVAFYLLVERPSMDPAWPTRLRARLTGKPLPTT